MARNRSGSTAKHGSPHVHDPDSVGAPDPGAERLRKAALAAYATPEEVQADIERQQRHDELMATMRKNADKARQAGEE